MGTHVRYGVVRCVHIRDFNIQITVARLLRADGQGGGCVCAAHLTRHRPLAAVERPVLGAVELDGTVFGESFGEWVEYDTVRADHLVHWPPARLPAHTAFVRRRFSIPAIRGRHKCHLGAVGRSGRPAAV
ncbi:unnamed protein product [Sphagnum balticum]